MSSQLHETEVPVADPLLDLSAVHDGIVIDLREPRLVVDQPTARRSKRAAEFVVALVLATLTLPLQLLCLALSAASFRANPLFMQTRVGRGQQPFRFMKIRSLPTEAPSEAPKGEIALVANSWVGKILRRTHLDELVQLWSVVTGTMSLVGPRPEMLGLSSTYPSDFVELRTTVRPGVTGLWQISVGSQGLIGETPQFDAFYVVNSNWRLDLWICVRTVSKMVGGQMVELADVPDWAHLKKDK